VLYRVASGLRKIQEARKDERGFTLLELLVVVIASSAKTDIKAARGRTPTDVGRFAE
jgi:prepilin-type N-terminal cleavage/methylation domain-containing protein